jgi:hypothetical protein
VIAADEDSVFELPVTVRNTGNCEVDFEVRAVNNLGEELLTRRSRLAPASSEKQTVPVLGVRPRNFAG